MATVKEMKPIYKEKPYVILSKENVVLHAGTFESCLNQSSYYDDCRIEPRKYDLYLNDNTKIDEYIPEPEDHSDDICPCGDPDCNRPFGHN